MKFNEDFLWGGATAAEQSEGEGTTKKGETVWNELYRIKPELFYNDIGQS